MQLESLVLSPPVSAMAGPKLQRDLFQGGVRCRVCSNGADRAEPSCLTPAWGSVRGVLGLVLGLYGGNGWRISVSQLPAVAVGIILGT